MPRYVTANGTAIYRHLLPAKGSTAPPRNDDFRHATVLGPRLPVHTRGVIGHATSQRGDPRLPGSQRRSVWYAFRPASSGRILLGVQDRYYGVFTGARLGRLHRVRERPVDDNGTIVRVRAGRTYRIMVVGGPAPWYEPFTVDIERHTITISAEPGRGRRVSARPPLHRRAADSAPVALEAPGRMRQ